MDQQKQDALKALIDTEPLNSGKTDAQVLDWLTEAAISVPKNERQTITSLMAELGIDDGYNIIDAIETAAAQDPKLKLIADLLKPAGGGVDLAHAESQAFIDALVTGAILTAQQGADLKSVGFRLISRAQNAGLIGVTIDHVIKARA